MLRSLLENPKIYNIFQDAIGGNRARRWAVEQFVCVEEGQNILDVGCGPGELFRYLPNRDYRYIGIDISEEYIEAARAKYSNRGEFFHCDCTELARCRPGMLFDWVVCMGLLHHLDDDHLKSFLESIRPLLAKTGRIVCLEPTIYPETGKLKRIVMGMDRGQYVRTEEQWSQVFRNSGFKSSAKKLSRAFRIPYDIAVWSILNK